MSTSTNAYAIECQKCGHAWLASLETIRAPGRAAMRCPVCEPCETRVLPTPVAEDLTLPAPPRLSPELGGKTWVITRARRARV